MTILHVQTHAGNIDASCWIAVVSCSDVPISFVSTVTVVYDLMVVSIVVVCDRCVVIAEISVLGTTSGSCDVVVFVIMDDI